jgi:uncharacterized RDD family membrane protein YckC
MNDVERGVYYAPSDYIGFIRRTLIDFVDGLVLLVAWLVCIVGLMMLHLTAEEATAPVILSLVGLAFAYLVVLKRYAFTLGYLLFRSRVVNLQGTAPSIGSLIVRALFLFIGPGNTLLDLIWLTSDPDRQAIRDRFARTYVIRRDAKPLGTGHIRYMRLDLICLNLLLPEVARESGQTGAATQVGTNQQNTPQP